MKELTTKEVISFLKSHDIELCGVAPIDSVLTDDRYRQNIEQICPNAKCIIVFANIFPQSALDACPENTRPARFTLEALYSEGAQICIKLSRFLEKHGFRGIIIPAYLPVEMSFKTLGLKGDINLKLAAVEAGLGTRGKNDLVITPDYGPRVRLFGVITDADLECTPKLDKNFCIDCDACIKACPSGALSESGCDPKRCAPYAMKYGLPQILRFISELEKETKQKKIFKKLRGLEIWDFWQALSQGSFYDCFNCIKVCPIGKIKFNQ